MSDFIRYLETDPKHYFLLDHENREAGVPRGYCVLFVKGGCLGQFVIEDDREAEEFCRWLIDHGARVINSDEEIDWDINPHETFPPPISFVDAEWQPPQ